jgi:hypothetical protein
VANFGVAILARRQGGTVEPRIVAGADENRLLGTVALPTITNPYVETFGLGLTPVAAVLRPTPGVYSIAFDTRGRRGQAFTFRFWVDDVTPPTIVLRSRRGRTLTARVTDLGSGVAPNGVLYSLDGRPADTALFDPESGLATIDLHGARPGRHRLEIRAYDYQELKNTENAGGVLPNTRVLRTTVTVPR